MTLNILVTSDDGHGATGLQVLLDSIQQVWPSARPTVIVSSEPGPGSSMSLSKGWDTYLSVPALEVEDRVFTLPLTPADLMYRAFYKREEFSKRDWDLVLVGCNHGANIGFDIFHSGTTGMAMIAARGFGTASFAFSQDLPDNPDLILSKDIDRAYFSSAERIIPDFLRKQAPDSGVCWNVNIPEEASRGYKMVKAAHYSYHRTPPTRLVPRASVEENDIRYLMEGWVTTTPLELRVNPNLRF